MVKMGVQPSLDQTNISKSRNTKKFVLKNLTGLWGAVLLFKKYYFLLTLHANFCVGYDIQCLVSLVSLHGRSDRGRNAINFSVTNTQEC